MKEIQERIKKFCKENNLSNSPEIRFIDLVSELGEVGKEIIKSSDYGKKEHEIGKEVKEEIGDLFFSLIVLSNSLNISLDEALEIVLEKYKKRLKKGSIGSENS